jgi:hypothetical protein
MHLSKLLVWTLAVGLTSVLSSVLLAQGPDAGRSTPKELVFSATPDSKGVVVYKVDSVPVSDPLRGLGKAIEKYGDDLPVICLVDSRLQIRLLSEAAALAGKAGFKNVRTFALDHSSGMTSEVKLGPWTTAP